MHSFCCWIHFWSASQMNPQIMRTLSFSKHELKLLEHLTPLTSMGPYSLGTLNHFWKRFSYSDTSIMKYSRYNIVPYLWRINIPLIIFLFILVPLIGRLFVLIWTMMFLVCSFLPDLVYLEIFTHTLYDPNQISLSFLSSQLLSFTYENLTKSIIFPIFFFLWYTCLTLFHIFQTFSLPHFLWCI